MMNQVSFVFLVYNTYITCFMNIYSPRNRMFCKKDVEIFRPKLLGTSWPDNESEESEEDNGSMMKGMMQGETTRISREQVSTRSVSWVWLKKKQKLELKTKGIAKKMTTSQSNLFSQSKQLLHRFDSQWPKSGVFQAWWVGCHVTWQPVVSPKLDERLPSWSCNLGRTVWHVTIPPGMGMMMPMMGMMSGMMPGTFDMTCML